jgi:hypothetical protein
MKKTIISKNYSLLVLILLILYLTYINLPEEINNMRGGYIDLNNPYLSMDDDTLKENLESHSQLYSLLNKYIYVYGGVVFVLLILVIYFAQQQFTIQGAPAFGIEPGLSWDSEGMGFLNFFYLLSKQRYGLLKGANSPQIDDKLVASFESDFDKFILHGDGVATHAIDLYCNAVAPCNMCACSGPDPKYGGPIQNAPVVPFKGRDANFGSCVPENKSGAPSPADAAKGVLKYQASRGVSDLIFGRIPDCCCQLWKTALGVASNFTAAKLQAFARALPASLDISTATGCNPGDPSKPPTLEGKVDGVESVIQPHVSPSGENQYIYNMVTACAAKNELTELTTEKFKFKSQPTVTSVSDSFMKCKDYNLLLDEGITAAFAIKNASTHAENFIGNAPSTGGDHVSDVTPSWTSGVWTQTGGAPPVINPTKPTNWPTVAPFTGNKTVNKYWFKSSENVLYELTVYNRLYEVSAYPVKKGPDSRITQYIDTTIYDTEITDTASKNFLNLYLTGTFAGPVGSKDLPFMYGGSYYFP